MSTMVMLCCENFMLMNLKRWGFYVVFLAVSGNSTADGLKDPEGFNTPIGYQIHRSEVEDFGRFFHSNDPFLCHDKKICSDGDFGFNATGHIDIDGRIEHVQYARTDGQAIPYYLLFKNYDRVIKEMGGERRASMLGGSESKSLTKYVYVLPAKKPNKLIYLSSWEDSRKLNMVVVTLATEPQILMASELKSQIDAAGFATLNVHFDTNKAIIRAEDKSSLDQVTVLLQEHPGLRLSVDGHTDNVGGVAANKKLSKDRAVAIVEYLKNAGIDGSRLKPQGFGADAPIADNRNELGRAKNRRVELVKLK